MIRTGILGLLGILASCGQPEGAPGGATATPAPTAHPLAPTASLALTVSPSPAPIAPCATLPPGRLVFLRDGAVIRKDLPGGEERPRTPAEGYTRLSLSPDGTWILAWKGEAPAVLLKVEDATALPLPGGVRAAAWAPSGTTLAYADDQGLWILEPAAGPARLLRSWEKGTHLDPAAPVPLAWSPDGARLAFSYERLGSSPGQIVEQGLAWVDRAGTLRRVWAFPNSAQDQAWLAGWSGDGQWLLFWHGLHRSMSLAADGLELLAIPAAGDASPRRVADPVLPWPAAIAPQPGTPVVVVMAGGGRETWHHKSLIRVDLTTGEQRSLLPPDRVGLAPRWSPDGRRLAFVTAPDAGEAGDLAALAQRRIGILGPEEGPPRILPAPHGLRMEGPRWADSGAFVLSAGLQDDQAALWLLAADGSCGKLVGERLALPQMVAGAPASLGFYGRIDWDGVFDFRPGVRSSPP